MPHQLKILHANDFGYVAICEDCDHIHVELGSFMAIVCQSSFKMILEDFKQKNSLKTYFLNQTPSGNKMVIQVTKNTYITLTEEEFESAMSLFNISSHLLEALSIINH